MKKLTPLMAALLLVIFSLALNHCSKPPMAVDNREVTNGQNTTAPIQGFAKSTAVDPETKLIRKLNRVVNVLSRTSTRFEKISSQLVGPPTPAIIDQLNNIRTQANLTIEIANGQIALLGRDHPALQDAWNNIITQANHLIELVDAVLSIPQGREPGVEQPGIVKRLEHLANKLSKVNRKLEHILDITATEDEELNEDD